LKAAPVDSPPYPTLYHVPEVLVETANMRSPTDAALLDDPGFRARVAQACPTASARSLPGHRDRAVLSQL
jgi:hypothetical protein